MEVSIHSNIGKRRKTNQDYADYFKSSHGQYLFVLCDGVGGHQAGEVASELTTKFMGEHFTALTEKLSRENVTQWIHQMIHDVNDHIYQESLKQPSLDGMGTTLIFALIVDGFIYIAHVGDSRAYAFYNNDLVQLTEDHSLVNELIRLGEITEEEGINHPRKNVVTQSIGVTPDVSYELNYVLINEIERLMLCSDGLTNMVAKDQLIQYFKEHYEIKRLGDELIDAANNAGGQDNITVILVTYLNEPIESVGEMQ